METIGNKVVLSWTDVHERLRPIDKEGWNVYGVPKGGMIATAFLQNAHAVGNPAMADVILDDIIDSGRTLQYYRERYPKKMFVCLVDKTGDEDLTGKWVEFPWETDHPTGSSAEDNVLRILQCIGEDASRPGLKDTPSRVVRSWAELFKGYTIDLTSTVTMFDEGDGFEEIVLLRDVEMYSTCEHHMLPFFGKAHIAYLPDKRLIGVSKLARILEAFSRRLQIQERIGKQVTEFLMDPHRIGARGAACIIEASHLCMQMRGVGKQNSVMTTSSLQGVFMQSDRTRAELLQLIFGGRG